MTLTELQAEVYTLTNRPDRVAQTLAAIRAATLKLHQMDYFSKDIFETGFSFATSTYIQQLEFRPIIPLWRAVKYLRKTDITGTQEGGLFTLISPENILDDYKITRSDVFYAAGDVLQIKSSTQFQYAIVGCYLNPNITVSGFNSWIALNHPYAIVYEAAAAVFKMIGDTDQFSAYTLLAAQQAMEVKLSGIQPQGY